MRLPFRRRDRKGEAEDAESASKPESEEAAAESEPAAGFEPVGEIADSEEPSAPDRADRDETAAEPEPEPDEARASTGASEEAASEGAGSDADPAPAMTAAERVREAGAPLLDGLADRLPGARKHADSTAVYSFAIAAELGVDRGQAELIREVARLHEVGKVYVPSEVAARPPAELLPAERTELEAHHEHGRALALGAGLSEEVADWIIAASERHDARGRGGLAGRAIPLPARIIRAASTYAAAVALRGAARWRGEPREAGLARIRVERGEQLDPEVVDALIRVLDRAAARVGTTS